MSIQNFKVRNGLNVNSQLVIDGNANAYFNSITANTITLTSGSVGLDQFARNTANSAGIYANTGITLAQAAFNQANTGGGSGLDQYARDTANSAGIYANTGINNAASASQYANTGINNAASASVYANTAINNAASASAYANTIPSTISSNNSSVTVNDTGSNANVDIVLDGTRAVVFTANAILPQTDQTYDLGSASLQWRDVYIGPGSLYINGQKVIEESSGTIKFSADPDQNLRVETTGDGNIELDPTQTGSILLQGPVQIQSNSNISSSDGNPIGFGSAIAVDSITSKTINTNLGLSANGSGVVSVNDDLTVTGNLVVQGIATSLSVTSLSVEDNIIDINSETTGNPTSNAGIRVVRGDEPAVQLRWSETVDKWQFTNDGSTYKNIADESELTNKFNSTGGTITGNVTISGNNNLVVTGNLFVQGNTVTTNTQSFVVADPVILLASNNFYTDAKDIGFAAHYNDGTNAHTGFIRDYVTKEYYIFDNYTPELDANNEININDASFREANVHAGFFKGNVIGTTVVSNGVDLGTYTQSAFNQANTGVNNAASASLYANAGITLAQAAYNQGNSTATTANTDYTTVSVTPGVYGNATIIPVVTVAANGRITSVSNTSISVSGGVTTGKAIAMSIVFGG